MRRKKVHSLREEYSSEIHVRQVGQVVQAYHEVAQRDAAHADHLLEGHGVVLAHGELARHAERLHVTQVNRAVPNEDGRRVEALGRVAVVRSVQVCTQVDVEVLKG